MTKTNVARQILSLSLFLFTCFSLTACIKDNSEPKQANIPAGTAVKFEALGLNGTSMAWVIYTDGQENLITKFQPGGSWSHLYVTGRDNALITLKISSGSPTAEVRGRIYIHGALAKEATGNDVELTFK